MMHVKKKKEASWMGAACAAAHSRTDGSHTVPVPVPVSVYAENVKLRFCRQRQVAAGAASLLTQGKRTNSTFRGSRQLGSLSAGMSSPSGTTLGLSTCVGTSTESLNFNAVVVEFKSLNNRNPAGRGRTRRWAGLLLFSVTLLLLSGGSF